MSAASYLEGLPFEPDRFQRLSAEAIDDGHSVVVTAPTGSGKTVVAEAAIHRALGAGERAFYTTPIKALSNQKFGDLQEQYGAEGVGLLTGDNSINAQAPVVVMTTEVLRNMMYAGSPDLEDVGVVVLDEVHYLQDRARGGVWEEIIIHLDRAIPLVCLSATVANAEEFASWIKERRGETSLIQEERRSVPLEVTYLVRDRFARNELRLFPTFSGDTPNERLTRMLRKDRGRRQRYAAPRRHETCEYLAQRGLMPAIYFIFSRKGCEAAARTVVDRGLRLTTGSESDEIVERAHRAAAHLDPLDLQVIGFDSWIELLRRGVAAHHAGMVPAMKEIVEQLFAAGLVRVVFATETLALGINMPARTVVLEQLSKFTGEGHELLQPGDFTQLTGRAGRRGIDTEGTAVVLHSPYVEFERAAGIAARGSHALRSSFRPTYNMAVNLVARYRRRTATELLSSSFAEFARSREHRKLEREISEDEERLQQLRAEASHPDVDVFALLDADDDSHAEVMRQFAAKTSPGAVLEWEDQGATRRVAVVAASRGKRPRLLTITEDGRDRRFATGKLPESIRMVGSIDLPRPFKPRDAAYRQNVASRIPSFQPSEHPEPAYESSANEPDVTEHLRSARAARRLEARIESRRRRAAAAGPDIIRRFDAIVEVLDGLGYVDGWTLSPAGEQLRTIYNELDLLLAETLRAGLWEGLPPAETAGLASAFTFEARHDDGPERWPPALAAIGDEVDALWRRLVQLERPSGLDPTRQPDPGFAPAIMTWVRGAPLSDLFDPADPGIGDFVRNARQLIDLLRQVDDVDAIGSSSIPEALGAIDRGVVAAAGAV